MISQENKEAGPRPLLKLELFYIEEYVQIDQTSKIKLSN